MTAPLIAMDPPWTCDSLRTEIAVRSRRHGARQRGVLDLPDELLLAIFEFVDGFDFDPSSRSLALDRAPWCDGDHGDVPPPMYYCGRTRVSDIKSVRLVCRRFNALASGLLVRLVRVYPTAASLAQFDAISRHPTISKGVRGVFVVLHFYADECLDFREFVKTHANELSNQRTQFEESSRAAGRPSGLRDEDAAEVLDKAFEAYNYLDSMYLNPGDGSDDDGGGLDGSFDDDVNDANDGETPGDPLGREFEARRRRIHRIHQEFCWRLNEAEVLVDGGAFAQAMGTAMARLPGPLELGFGDSDFVRPRELMVGYGIDIWDAVHRRMLQPGRALECRRSDLDLPCYELVPGIITAAVQAGALPFALRLHLTTVGYPNELDPSPDGRKAIASGMSNLREFSFSYIDYAKWDSAPMAFLSGNLNEFLAPCLDMPNLRRVTVDLGVYALYEPLLDVAEILGMRARPCLTDLSLCGFIVRLPYLVQLLRGLPDRLDRLHLAGIELRDGTWREALDVLRTKQYGMVRLEEACGAECGAMLPKDYRDVFEELGDTGTNIATLYIMGHDPEAPNPLQKLEDNMAG